MSSVGFQARCPMCGDEIGPFHVQKEDKIIDWELSCVMCGHWFGKGSYWMHYPGGYVKHCETCNWKIPKFLKGFETPGYVGEIGDEE